MIAKGNYLPTQRSKAKPKILISLIILIYILENSPVISIIDSRTFNYIIKPAIWLSTAYLVWSFPKARPKGKLKLKSFLNFWAFNFGIIYIIVSVMAGMIDGLGKSPYSHSPTGILTNIVFVGSMLVGREFIRSYLVNNSTREENYFIFIFIALLMTFTSITLSKYLDIKDYEGMVKFVAEYFAPEFAQNLLATYLVFLGGPLTSIIYLGIIKGFHWLSPILPDLSWITKALIGVLCPIFCFMSIQSIYLEASKKLKKRDKDEESPFSWMITSIISIAIIWFAVGVFPIYPSVVATGSMEPMIKAGDVILVEKIVDIEGIDNLKQGDVIQFERDGILISHRIIEIIESKKGKSYRTKGDNNSGPDTELVKIEQIKGKIVHVVPKIGWPTLLIKNKDDIPLDEIVF